MKCQCETNHCPHHMDDPCPNEATERVSPSYAMCGPCAAHYRAYTSGQDGGGLIDRDRKPECGKCGYAPVVWREDGSVVCPECGEVSSAIIQGKEQPVQVCAGGGAETFTRWEITKLPRGMAAIRSITNDDNDDGVADAEVTTWEAKKPMKLAKALEMAGRQCHVGGYGQPVEVLLDGVRVIRWGEKVKR